MDCIIPRVPLTVPAHFFGADAIIVASSTQERALTENVEVDCSRVVDTSARKGSYSVNELKQIAIRLGIYSKGPPPNKPELVRMIRAAKC